MALRPGRREDDVERAVRADGQIVEIIGVLCRMMLAGAQGVGAKLRQDHHPGRAAIAPDAIGAALFDQRRLVDGVCIGLKDILADIEFGHEDRMAAVMHDRVVGGAQDAGKQQTHGLLHHLRVFMQPRRDAIAHLLAQRAQLVEQLFPFVDRSVRHLILRQ